MNLIMITVFPVVPDVYSLEFKIELGRIADINAKEEQEELEPKQHVVEAYQPQIKDTAASWFFLFGTGK